MKRIKSIICSLLLVAASSSFAAQTGGPRLVVCADDMGAFHSVNMACQETYRKGITQSVEVMVVAPWYPEAVKMLKAYPGVDVGIHLTITSEWENMKWRPLTNCPSLTDKDGYFFPMMGSNKAYPLQSVQENKWSLAEVEQEFRAQIELGLKTLPQVSHITNHMGCVRFDKEVLAMVTRLAQEYHLTFVEGDEMYDRYNVQSVGYAGSSKTSADKEASFIRMLEKLQPGRNYIFLDHPALDNDEMQTVGHVGYEGVAADRQGVTDLFTSEKVKQLIKEKDIELISYNDLTKSLPCSTPVAEKVSEKGIAGYLDAVRKSGQDLHSLMIVRHGKVVAEQWFGDNAANKPHIMNSVSKTFTATAIGFAVMEKRLRLTDKVISFFPEKLPAQLSPFLKELQVSHLLTMSVGQDARKVEQITKNTENTDWVKAFLSFPIDAEPGSEFSYNSMATYMLSAIIQRVTGEKVIDYLYPRLLRPLGITGAIWQESPQGINCGGWGLYIKTEDMAKMGQFLFQKGKWNGEQLLAEAWIEEATSFKIASLPAGAKKQDLKMKPQDSDWLQGYGYKIWMCRHNAFRADGANGQFIIVIPEKDAVIVTTANVNDMQAEINLIWKYLLPALK